MVNILGKNVPAVGIVGLIALAFIIFVWPVGLLMPHAPSEHMNAVPGVGLLNDSAYNAYLKTLKPSNNISNSTNNTGNIVVGSNTADNEKTTGSPVYSITDFKDWVNGKMTVTTDVNNVEVFTSVEDPQALIDEAWDKNFDRKWNIDHAAVQFANKFGNDDPAKSIFFTSSDMFVVTLKTNGIGPQVWTPNKDGVLQKVTSGKKNVYGLDRVSKTA